MSVWQIEQIKRKQSKDGMLRHNTEGEVEYLTFPALDGTGMVKHLFSTRRGGVSEGIFSSMNLSYTRGDKKEHVDENFRRIAAVLQTDVSEFACSDQTHTTNIRKITKEDRGKGIIREKDYTDIDGLITNEPGIVLSTFYADCVPLFLVDTKNRAIGLSHSGWRGTVNRMGKCTLEAMKEAYGTEPSDVIAAIGPSICKDCYEVSRDVAEKFKESFCDNKVISEILFPKGNGKYLLDLWKANAYVFLEAGVPEENISITDICTCCNGEYLFSHRASEGKRGNLGAFLVISADHGRGM